MSLETKVITKKMQRSTVNACGNGMWELGALGGKTDYKKIKVEKVESNGIQPFNMNAKTLRPFKHKEDHFYWWLLGKSFHKIWRNPN